jgi:hypothetical protein
MYDSPLCQLDLGFGSVRKFASLHKEAESPGIFGEALIIILLEQTKPRRMARYTRFANQKGRPKKAAMG